MAKTVGVPRETYPGERRVALVPAGAAELVRAGLEVLVEQGAGERAGYPDDAYREHARLVPDRNTLFAEADVILQVRGYGANPGPGAADLPRMRRGQIFVGFWEPLVELEALRRAAERGATVLAMELMPRITRAQAMDALSSMATLAGYKAVLLAAHHLPRMFPLMMTAAGTLAPARVFVVGAGVAGLQAIATSRRLGAVVQAYDVRPAVKEQVQSLGAKFVELPLDTADAQDKAGYARELGEDFYRRQRETMTRVVAESDVVITTALVPGKRAPVLITEPMVRGMAPGSVIVDLAAERGGNCELTQPGETVTRHGVTILGPVNLPAEVPYHASQLYSKNAVNFLRHMVREGRLVLQVEDEIVRETLVTHEGEVVHPRVRDMLLLKETTGRRGTEE